MPRSIYYKRREPVRPSEFEEGYWGVVKDPDGKVRDLAKERDKKVEDLATELAFVNKLPPGRILDVGCGLGHLLSGVDPRWERHGIEISEYAAEKAREHGTIHHGDLRSAGYADRSFDVVTLYHVIEHMEDPERELREIKRVIRPGGWIVVGTPNFDSACARRFGEKFRMLHDATHISLFGAESLRRLLEDNGFAVEQEDYPYFETRYFNRESLDRLFDANEMSPPFYGSIMTFYAQLPERSAAADSLALAGRAAWRIANDSSAELDRARHLVDGAARSGGTLHVAGEAREPHAAVLRALGRTATALGSKLPDAATASDVVLVVGDAGAGVGALADARRRGIPVIAIMGEGATGDAEVVLRVPSDAPHAVRLGQELVLLALATPGAVAVAAVASDAA
jgi:2-polyprenyl-3-methyl-5-hydroxy-6-metoxy-1,4-benzoquinol methylase